MQRIVKNFCIIMLLFSCSCGFAAHEKTKLQKLTAKIASLKQNLTQKTEQQQSLSDELEAAEKEISKVSLKVRSVQKKIRAQNKKLQPLLRQQKKLQSKLATQRQALAQQLIAIYKTGQHSYLQLFLNQQDPSQISRMASYFHAINQARTDLIKQFTKNLAQVQTNQTAINVVINDLQVLKEKQVGEQNHLRHQQRIRKNLLRKIKQQIKTSKQRITQLEKDKRKLQGVVDNLNAEKSYEKLSGVSFARLRRRLPWPVKGTITRKYGQLYDGRLSSNGVFIKAPSDQPIRAVASGQVIFANWLRGYGNLLIVSHKGGYMTLYAHANALLKQVGDNVKPGEEIGLVGNSGGLINPGLYFEIRYKGKTRNPSLWCR